MKKSSSITDNKRDEAGGSRVTSDLFIGWQLTSRSLPDNPTSRSHPVTLTSRSHPVTLTSRSLPDNPTSRPHPVTLTSCSHPDNPTSRSPCHPHLTLSPCHPHLTLSSLSPEGDAHAGRQWETFKRDAHSVSQRHHPHLRRTQQRCGPPTMTSGDGRTKHHPHHPP